MLYTETRAACSENYKKHKVQSVSTVYNRVLDVRAHKVTARHYMVKHLFKSQNISNNIGHLRGVLCKCIVFVVTKVHTLKQIIK